MTKIVIIICSVVFPLLAACSDNRGEYARRLSRADSLLPVRPDSAWRVLQEVSLADLRDEGEQAWYALLQTEAAVRGGHSLSDDSLIRAAVDYYDHKGDIGMQARAHYWAGNAYRRLEEEEQALREYWRAEELAREEGDMQLLGAIYNNWAYLIWVNGLEQEADSLYGLAGQIATQRNDSLLLGESWCRSGAIALDKGKAYYPKAEKLLLQGYEIARQLGNKQLQRIATSSLSTLYARMEKGEKSLRYAKENWALQSDTSCCFSTYALLGEAYYRSGYYDSASYYLQKALPSADGSIDVDVFMRLADIAKKEGDNSMQAMMERKYSTKSRAYFEHQQGQMQALSKVMEDLRTSYEQVKIREHGKIYLLYIGGLLFALFVAFVVWRRRNRQQKGYLQQQNDELSSEQIRLAQRLEEKEAEIAALRTEMATIQSQAMQAKQMQLKQLQEEKKALLKEEFEHLPVYAKMKRIMVDYARSEQSEEEMSEEDWLQLEEATNRRWNQICLKLRQYELTPTEIRLCCLRLTDFEVSRFVCLFHRKRDFYYKTEGVILEKRMHLPPKGCSLKKVLMDLALGITAESKGEKAE